MLTLRPYQQECIDVIKSRGNGRWLCQLATGLGKTVIFANIPRRGRTLILSHRQELVRQPLKYFDCETGIEMGTSRANNAEVVSASVQTMCRRLAFYSPEAFTDIIIDECHHAAAKSYSEILKYFSPLRIIGFTATPNRADGQGLEGVFDDIIFQRDLKWGIENGWLSPIQCRRINIGYDLAGVATRMGDYSQSDLQRVCNIDKCNMAIAEAVRNLAEKPVLIFAVDVAHARAIADCIPGAVALDASSKDRDAVVEEFKQGNIEVLVNCALFTEGTDLPNTRTVIIARPTKSVALYTQMVGRGTRLSPGKDHMLLMDCVGVSRMPLCTAPSLLGLSLDDIPMARRTEIEGDLLADIPDKVESQADTPESWINNIRNVDIWAKGAGYELHNVNWHRTPDGSMRIRLPKTGGGTNTITITAPNLRGMVTLVTSGGYKKEYEAQEAYDIAFNILRYRFPEHHVLWNTQAIKRWGKQEATTSQIDYIRRLAKTKGVVVAGVLNEGLNKMQANSLIERLKDSK